MLGSQRKGRKSGRPGGSPSPRTHRPIIVVAVVVKQTLFLLQVEADPVMEANDPALLHFACNEASKADDLDSLPTIPAPVPFLPLPAKPVSRPQALTSRILHCIFS